MTFEEYLEKRAKIDQYILEELKDDKTGEFVYQATLCMRQDDESGRGTTELCKKYSNVEGYMKGAKEVWEDLMPYDLTINDCEWWEVEKYILTDGEYREYLECNLSADGELIRFFVYPGYLEEFLKAENTVDVLCCRNVDAPYQTGDVLKVKNKPMSDDSYIIYCYDETKAGNKHLQLSLTDEISFVNLTGCTKLKKPKKVRLLQLTR